MHVKKFKDTVIRFVWDTDLHSLPFWQGFFTRVLRTIYAVLRDLTQGQLTLQAMSLVYTTLLSLVPLLAVSFSVLKGFGVHNQVEPFLLNFMAPLGEEGVEITKRIIGFVENVDVGVLGSVGLGFLVYMIVALIYKIEKVFNFTWHVKHPRPFVQRFSDYLSVILIGPVLVFSALGTMASVMSIAFVQKLVAIESVGLLIDSTTRIIPYLFIIGAFSFVYIFVPNTRVRFSSALLGAVVAGWLWQTIGWAFAAFIVSSTTQYAAIYSSFAILILFMIWLYLAWLILLVGSSIAFYYQHPQYLSTRQRDLILSNSLKERLALLSMYVIGKSHFQGEKAWTEETLAQHLGVPTVALKSVLLALEERYLLIRAGDESPVYVPARAPEMIPIKEILEVVRTAEDDRYFNTRKISSEEKVDQLIEDVNGSVKEVLKGLSLRDLVLNETFPLLLTIDEKL
jgi:membrane protein